MEAVFRDFGGDFETITMETTYYDTENRDFAANRWSLRCRRENGVCVCNLKLPLTDHSRGEWECVEESIAVGAKKLAAMSGCKALIPLAEKPLVPTCGARFTRRAKTVSLPDCTVEIALDEGTLLGGGNVEPLCEIEVELKAGNQDAAAAFSGKLAEKYGLQPENRSKFARAKALEERNGV